MRALYALLSFSAALSAAEWTRICFRGQLTCKGKPHSSRTRIFDAFVKSTEQNGTMADTAAAAHWKGEVRVELWNECVDSAACKQWSSLPVPSGYVLRGSEEFEIPRACYDFGTVELADMQYEGDLATPNKCKTERRATWRAHVEKMSKLQGRIPWDGELEE